MSQYGESNNPFRPESQRYAPYSEAKGAGQGNGSSAVDPNGSLGVTSQHDTPTDPSRPSSDFDSPGSNAAWESRRRNQWRQFQRLQPTYASQPETAPPPRSSRPAALPALGGTQTPPSPRPNHLIPLDRGGVTASPDPTSRPGPGSPDLTFLQFSAKPTPTSTSRPTASRPPGPPVPVSRSLSDRPVVIPGSGPSRSSGPAGTIAGAGSPRRLTTAEPLPTQATDPAPRTGGTVTPLRPRSQATGSSSRRSPLHQPRPTSPRVPLPVLYLIRLLILGVGVAAIAGTLLSMFSPANLASESTANGSATTAAINPAQGLLPQNQATATVDGVPLTSELTRLKSQLEQLSTLTPGLNQFSFMVDLDDGRFINLNGETAVAAASTIKVPVLVAFLQAVDSGTVALNQALTLQNSEVAGGSGDMQSDPVGTQYTALEVATRMIINSDNTATNMMIDLLGGQEVLNQRFQDWGLTATVIRNPLPDLEGTNTTSARDLALLVGLVDRGGLVSSRSRDRMFAIMQRTDNRSLIPSGVASGAIIANKTGDIASALGDVALIDAPNGTRYVLATLVQRPDNDGRAGELIRRIAEATHKELNQPLAPVGAAGAVSPAPSSDETIPTEPVPPGFTGQPSPASDEPQPVGDQIPQG